MLPSSLPVVKLQYRGMRYLIFFSPSVDKTFKYLLHMLTYKMENPINAVDLATVSSWNCSQLL